MRLTEVGLIGAALALAACGSQSEDGNAARDTGMTAEAITANDVTAIDAVTGDAANMAAEVDYSNVEVDNRATATAARPRAAKPKAAAKKAADGAIDPIRAAPDEVPANTAQ